VSHTIDRIGQKFGLLTVVARAPGRTASGGTVWFCHCECGVKNHTVHGRHLKVTQSCGCLKGNRVRKERVPLTQERLIEFLHYSPETGMFFRKITKQGHAKPGDRAGCVNTHGYLEIGVDGKRYQAHRLAWFYIYNSWPKELDHINRNRADCRIANLRITTRSQNSANRKTNQNKQSNRLKGVYPNGSGWQARVKYNGKNIYFGTFATPELAHAVYCYAAKRLHGEFFCNGKD
jgi:hypothetical protein